MVYVMNVDEGAVFYEDEADGGVAVVARPHQGSPSVLQRTSKA